MRRLWVFSDLHLENLESELGRALLRVLSQPEGPGDVVVFAGDVFELWVGGSRYFTAKFAAFSDALRALIKKGVCVWYIEGNHDFHLSKVLPAGVGVAPGEVVLDLQGPGEVRHRLLIEHGDLADREDRSYRAMRGILRSAAVRVLSGCLPGKWVQACAALLSRPAHRKVTDLPEHWSAERRERLRSVYRGHARLRRDQGFDWVVLGHCHDLDEWGGFYWNMGYPPVHRQYLVFDPVPGASKVSLERRNFL